MGLGQLDEGVDALVVGELGKGEDGLFLDLDVAVLAGELFEAFPDFSEAIWPSQKTACFRTSRFSAPRARAMSSSTAAGSSTWLMAKTAPSRTSSELSAAGRLDEEPQAVGVVLLADPEGRVLPQLVGPSPS